MLFVSYSAKKLFLMKGVSRLILTWDLHMYSSQMSFIIVHMSTFHDHLVNYNGTFDKGPSEPLGKDSS